MLKLKLDRGDGPLVVLGLSHMNLERLKAGDPIKFELAPFGMEGEFMIYAGATEELMLKELVDARLVDQKTAETMTRALRERQQ